MMNVAKQRTPNGHRVMFFAGPVHAGLVGGFEAKVSPAIVQLIGQAIALIVKGGSPLSKMGLGSCVGALPGLNVRLDGSIAYCHSSVASNSRSTAWLCC